MRFNRSMALKQSFSGAVRPQNDYLLPQCPNLRLKRRPRPKQPAQIWMFLVVPSIGGALAGYLFRLRTFEPQPRCLSERHDALQRFASATPTRFSLSGP
jgi:hypothetical protein